MDPNYSFNRNNSTYDPPAPYVSPLHEALLPFYNPIMNTYPQNPLPDQILQSSHETYIPINENWNYSAYLPQTTVVQANTTVASSHSGTGNNYLLNSFVLDTSANINPNNFIMTSVDQTQIFQCEKCPSRFYSRQAFGGHMSSHSKLAKKKDNMSQKMMAKADNEGGSYTSASVASKKRDRKKGNNVVVVDHEPKNKKQV